MGLENAHEGYEYQDLLTAYFILTEIHNETESQFTIDRKEYGDDKLDDLLISRKDAKRKVQIKYSNDQIDHTFTKANLATDNSYNLSIDSLYKSWLNHPERDTTEFRICLAWNEPVDQLQNCLVPVIGGNFFIDFPTKVFKINGEFIWPAGKKPLSSWRRFRKESASIDRNLFLTFCNQLLIEVELPKFSIDLNNPGDLERLVIGQAKKLGIGVFPNNHLTPESFSLQLLAMIKRSRSKGTQISVASVFHTLNIKTDYGKIEQFFPVIESENLHQKEIIESFIKESTPHERIILTGEPGSGKSWFIENLQKELVTKGVKVIRHYCYTRLDDFLQHERIKLNTFYGNLIYDIIRAFPALRNNKQEKLASNLRELNILLQSIQEPTWLIVDGLDHIDRIFHFRQFTDMAVDDIAIIDNIQKLLTSNNVKIIVVCQNIPQLEKFTNFKKLLIKDWTESDIISFLHKLDVDNILIKRDLYLSSFLLQKSSGNPLYIKYLLDEIRINPVGIDQLPPYSHNLKEYYSYLISRLNTREDVPQVLSGVNFSLTKTELEEITSEGHYVAQALAILSPVLKVNLSQSGYIIYHESFRRFIIDQLKEHAVSVEKKVFQPVMDWFATKDFFVYRKAYMHSLSFLFESGEFEKVLDHLKHNFVTQSIVNGQPWDLLIKNYKLFVKAACYQRNFPAVILLNEIDKILGTTENSFNELFSIYIVALGKIKGFNCVSEYLVFEGTPVFSTEEGIEACYVCDENNVVAPWELYMDVYLKSGKVPSDYLSYYIRGLLVLKKENTINSIAIKLDGNSDINGKEIFKVGLEEYKDQQYVTYLKEKYPLVKSLMDSKSVPVVFDERVILIMADQIIDFDNMFSNEVPVLTNFLTAVEGHVSNEQFIGGLIDRFKAKNWFYNWLIYYIKIIVLQKAEKVSDYNIKEAFDYLQYSTEPFLGNPRTCDLYGIRHILFQSFQEGLSLIKSPEQWPEIIDILVKVTNETTTTLQGSQGGPLPTESLFKLLSNYVSDNNRNYVNTVFEELSKDKEDHHLHSDIASYYFRLSSLFNAAGENDKADQYFTKAVEYAFGYTMRKDLTLLDAIHGIEFFAKVNPTQAFEDIKKLRVLVNSAVDHTDGKETYYFPVMWVERFLKNDFRKAALFLLHELVESRFDWRAEKSLIDLLCISNENIHPVIQFYLSFSLPCVDKESFVVHNLKLYNLLQKSYPDFAEKLMSRIIPSVQPKQNRRISNTAAAIYNQSIEESGIDNKFAIPMEKTSVGVSQSRMNNKLSKGSANISQMNPDELLHYLEEKGIRKTDTKALAKYFKTLSELTDPVKNIIQTLVRKNNRNDDKVELEKLFDHEPQFICFYYVCCFVLDTGGWSERFVNQEAFNKAYEIDNQKTIAYLFELLPPVLDIGFNIDYSANLIQALVNIGYDTTTITTMWNNLLEISSYRLPSQDPIHWETVLDDSLEMTIEEILIAIILSRFRTGTTERSQWATAGLSYFMEHSQDKLVKPLQWFFQKREKFLDTVLAIILQLLLKQKEKGNNYYLHFEGELKDIFPKHQFLIDFLLSQLLGEPLSGINTVERLIYPDLKENDRNALSGLNIRFGILEDCDIDMDHVFSKYLGGFRHKYEDYLKLYWNNAYKTSVPNVYSSEFLLDTLYTDHYNELKSLARFVEKDLFKYTVSIDTSSILAQMRSLALRPANLLKPHELSDHYTIDDFVETDWMRIAHYEKEFKDEGGLRSKLFKSYGGIVFSDKEADKKIFPYSDYRLYPIFIWGGEFPEYEIDKTVVFSILQDDPLESYKLLWLNPVLVKHLGLQGKNIDSGLVAINDLKEPVMKMRTWSTNYLGDGYRTSLEDEIARYQGTDLIIRKDYFDKLCSYFNVTPSYRTLRMEWPVLR
ncbi:MAG TPA: ATP-binding protein [Sediminibacterium sp.]|uniref:NACHT domain-containing protein n=1 Tax=Sediminibacterium sp. TaxID=1917865 RepID=UPI0008C90D8F|nr:ATP-binding protein [Sediminibacterium sp.]OHC84250.1 MAG: hypothetical protein A2472_12380 [Sphingobacteriia bacterium RIFOXYC2_FULL_35_18]OHC88799.1 MAG: hypothetical protein A2546_02805 [Sphingobacteriia bacterium RIFOXYD2_FULL_35_12]HLD53858.1 ATP-binding protein [Sediminibacterium sp.]